jgi:nitrogen fixation protein FixH
MKVSLIIFFIGFLTIAPSIYFGNKMFDGKVEANSYENGLAYDKIKSTIKNYDLAVAIHEKTVTEQGLTLKFSVDSSKPFPAENFAAEVDRPVAREALTGKLSESEGIYTLELQHAEKGYNILKVSFMLEGNEIALKKNFYVN